MARQPFNSFSKGFKLASVFLAIFVLAAVSKGFFTTSKKSARDNLKSLSPTITEIPMDSLALQDFDHDGLKDWEETLYRADPKNPDTDGDGTNDGDEISQNRDPVKKGPNDTLFSNLTADTVTHEQALMQKVLEGENLTKTITSQMLAEKGAGSFLNPAEAQKTASEIIGYLTQSKNEDVFSPDAIPSQDLNISSETSVDAIKTYFNAITRLYTSSNIPHGEDELMVVARALQEQNPDILQEIDMLIHTINTLSSQIKKISTPPPLVTIHKKELWFLQTTRAQLAMMRKAPLDDPFFILLMAQKRTQLKQSFSDFHTKEIPQFLREHTVQFSSGEPAFMLYSHL